MSYKFASSSAKQSLNLFSKSKIPPTKHIPDSMSFTSHVTKSRIFIRNRQPAGPLRASIKALYEPTESLYELLGVAESGSTVSDIKKAYKKMARKYHPDVSPPDRVDEHTRKFIMVKEAYETLSNPQRRAMYDTELLAQGLEFGFSAQYHQEHRMEEKWEWRTRWQSQLDELKSKNKNPSRGRMSWGARMRAQR